MNMPPEKVAVLVITGVIAILVSVTLLNSPERTDRNREREWGDDVAGGDDFDDLPHPDDVRRGEHRTRIVRERVKGQGKAPGVDPKPRPALKHTIRRNETLGAISRKYYRRESAWRIIKQANPGIDERRLKPGTEIIIPSLAGTRPVGGDPLPVRRAPPGTERGGRWHVVANGESLRRIARREYGAERHWKRIYAANKGRIRSPSLVRAGQRIFLPVASR